MGYLHGIFLIEIRSWFEKSSSVMIVIATCLGATGFRIIHSLVFS